MSEAEKTTPPDPFDLANLRLDQSFIESAGVKKLLTTVHVGKPGKQDFIRVHPDKSYRDVVALVVLEDDREIYLVTPSIARELEGEYKPFTLYTAVNMQGVVRLWNVRMPDPDGRIDLWQQSSAEGAQRAMTQWVRVKADMNLRAYQIHVSDSVAEPAWPEQTFQELVRIAFQGRLVDRLDHPVVKRLRGIS
jgi:hypothetical protein